MTLPTDWKSGKCLEWCTQLPLNHRPQTSPVFIIQNVEIYFKFSRERGSPNYFYKVHLKTKKTDALLPSFSFTTYINYEAKASQLNRYPSTLTSVMPIYFNESEFKNLKFNLDAGLPIRFFFVYEISAGLQLPSETETSEKSTQSDLMLSLETDVEHLSLDISELLKSTKHSDVQLLCNGGNIPAHKSILSARSETFSDMLQDGSKESKSGLINMRSTEISVMELCLEYVYKGRILNLPLEKASDLYVLGHSLKISSLKKMCADWIAANLSEDNYISSFVLAVKYNDDHFKSGLTDYVSNHADLLKSERWEEFSDNYPKTANNVHRKCLLKFLM